MLRWTSPETAQGLVRDPLQGEAVEALEEHRRPFGQAGEELRREPLAPLSRFGTAAFPPQGLEDHGPEVLGVLKDAGTVGGVVELPPQVRGEDDGDPRKVDGLAGPVVVEMPPVEDLEEEVLGVGVGLLHLVHEHEPLGVLGREPREESRGGPLVGLAESHELLVGLVGGVGAHVEAQERGRLPLALGRRVLGERLGQEPLSDPRRAGEGKDPPGAAGRAVGSAGSVPRVGWAGLPVPKHHREPGVADLVDGQVLTQDPGAQGRPQRGHLPERAAEHLGGSGRLVPGVLRGLFQESPPLPVGPESLEHLLQHRLCPEVAVTRAQRPRDLLEAGAEGDLAVRYRRLGTVELAGEAGPEAIRLEGKLGAQEAGQEVSPLLRPERPQEQVRRVEELGAGGEGKALCPPQDVVEKPVCRNHGHSSLRDLDSRSRAQSERPLQQGLFSAPTPSDGGRSENPFVQERSGRSRQTLGREDATPSIPQRRQRKRAAPDRSAPVGTAPRTWVCSSPRGTGTPHRIPLWLERGH